jgi:hypothetical protein
MRLTALDGSHPPGSQADPPGVFRQTTGAPEFDVAVVPSGPQGMPTAGRVSTVAVVALVVVVVGGECGLVVLATVVDGGADEVVRGAVVVANDGVGLGAVLIVGAGRRGETVVTEDGVSTLGGLSSDREAECNAMTPNNPPTATAAMVRTSPAVCSRR